jgi:hypothetical protein
LKNKKRKKQMEDINNVDVETAEEVETASSKQVVKYPVTLAKIAKLEEEYREIPDDLTIKANYELVRKRATHLRTLRGEVEKRRKELKADALAYGKLVDSTAKEITERLFAIEEPIATKKKDFDTAAEIAKREIALAEERRVDGIAGKIAGIRELVGLCVSEPSHIIKQHIDGLDQHDMAKNWADEFSDKAELAITETVAKLKDIYAMKVQQEQAATLAAEAEAKRKQEEEEARVERERLAEEARLKLVEEQAKLAEERRVMDLEKAKIAKEQEEKDKKAREEQEAKDAAARAEREKLEKEIADLKAAQEVKPEIKPEVKVESAHSDPPLAPTLAAVKQEAPSFTDDYRAAGNAMLKIIGNKETTKRVLDSIINNEVPNIQFTGAAQ